MHSVPNRLAFFALTILVFNPRYMHSLPLSSSCETRSFDVHSLPHGCLTFLGDSHFGFDAIALTKEGMLTDAPRSAGVVLYRHPILSLDPRSKKVPSFYTTFAFSIEITHGDKEEFGDGLAFLISPDINLLGSPGYLGLVDSTDVSRNKFIAIEFDTKRDSVFQDPDDNHVGLDINSLSSVKLATSSSLGVDMKSGDLISAWIEYKSKEKRLEVFMSKTNLKPNKPLLNVDIDLSSYVKENMFVGFSGARDGSRQMTRIQRWEFKIVEFSPPPPSPPESGISFPNPSEYRHKHSHLSRFAIGLIVGICSIPFVVLFCWFYWKKLMELIQKSDGRNNLEMQTITWSSEEISYQEILLSIIVDKVATGLCINKVSDNEAELKHVETVKSGIPLCDSLPAVKPSILPPCNSLPVRTIAITSV